MIITAVSGGVDSVVMLHMLANGQQLQAESKKLQVKKARTFSLQPSAFSPTSQRLVVAHFEHGIRDDGKADARFVAALAEKYKLPFELGTAKLGDDASEDQARRARQSFFAKLLDKYPNSKIATAHHHDDLIETAIINILRGTNRRGLNSLRDTENFLRPIFKLTKKSVYEYAQENKLEWVEDETNNSDKYLRNRIRHHLVPKLKKTKKYDRLVDLVCWFGINNPEINKKAESILSKNTEKSAKGISLSLHLIKEELIFKEVLAVVLQKLKATEIDSAEIERLFYFAQNAKNGQSFNQFPPINISKARDWLLFSKTDLSNRHTKKV